MQTPKVSPLNDPTNEAASERAQSAAFREFVLAKPPRKARARELWMQHGAGKILFEKVRAAGLATVDAKAPRAVRSAVELAVDATIYALMMQIDGVTGGFRGHGHELGLTFGVELRDDDGDLVKRIDLFHGDGMCMGFHGWREGDYGADPVADPIDDGE